MSPTIRRHDTYANLAQEFGVSVMTVRRDVQALMEMHHPVITVSGRYGGGITILEGYDPYHNTLTTEEMALLQKLSAQLEGQESEIMDHILAKLAS